MIDLKHIDLNKLHYFYLVASHKNISRAAEEVGLDQSGLTRHMQNLEKELGENLLIRSREGVQLTRAGEEWFKYVERMCGEFNAFQKKRTDAKNLSGKIRICSTHAIANYILAKPVCDFKKLHPEVEIELVGDDQIVDIIKGNIDILIRPYDDKNSDVTQIPLLKLQAKLYASPEYLKKRGIPKSITDLKNHMFIARGRQDMLPFYSNNVNWFLNIGNFISEKNVSLYANTVEVQFLAAEEGLGIISSYKEMSILKKSNLIQILPELTSPIYKEYLCYQNILREIPRIKKLEDHLKEVLNSNLEF